MGRAVKNGVMLAEHCWPLGSKKSGHTLIQCAGEESLSNGNWLWPLSEGAPYAHHIHLVSSNLNLTICSNDSGADMFSCER